MTDSIDIGTHYPTFYHLVEWEIVGKLTWVFGGLYQNIHTFFLIGE